MITHGFEISLGPIDREHLPLLRAWRNDYRIWKYCRQNGVVSEPDQERWYEAQGRDPSTRMFTIRVPKGGEGGETVVGVCGLTSIDLYNHRAEFSLYVGPEHWGNGYGKRALQTLLTHAFKTLGLNSVWGETFDGNPAAKIFEEVGMKHDGLRRAFYFREGKHLDAHIYSVRTDEWKP